MAGFDIQTLHDFHPPRFHCERCLAIYPDLGVFRTRSGQTFKLFCPTCRAEYLPTDTYHWWQLSDYLEAVGSTVMVRAEESVNHARTLAAIAMKMKARPKDHPPMRALLEALSSARAFVHFTSFGLSLMMIGALKVTAQRIPVRGVVSNAEPVVRGDLAFGKEAPQLDVKLFDQGARDAPHQKLVVVDGLIAFKGSANLTVHGWRKAAEDLDVVEMVTRLDEVATLHNRYFSPLWAEFSELKSAITMEAAPF